MCVMGNGEIDQLTDGFSTKKSQFRGKDFKIRIMQS